MPTVGAGLDRPAWEWFLSPLLNGNVVNLRHPVGEAIDTRFCMYFECSGEWGQKMENDTNLPDLVPLLGLVPRGRLIASPTIV